MSINKRRNMLWPWMAGVCITGLYVLCYSPALNGLFILDDFTFLFESVYTVQPSRLLNLGLLQVILERPLSRLFIHWCTHYSGSEAWVFQLASMIIHFFNALLFTRLCAVLLSKSKRVWLMAALGGAIFLLHPVQTQAVNYASQVATLLSTFFFLSGVLFYLNRNAKWWHVLLFIICSALGVLSKPIALSIFPVVLLLGWYHFKGYNNTASWISFSITIAGIFLAFSVDLTAVDSSGVRQIDYLLTQPVVFLKYIKLLFIPFPLSVDHYVEKWPEAFGSSMFAISALALFVLAIYGLKRITPLLMIGWFVWFLALMPESSIVPLKDFMNEHRLYLPMTGFALGLVALIDSIKVSTIKLWLVPIVCLYMATFSYVRNNDWSESYLLWKAALNSNTNSARAHFQLADYYEFEGAYKKAQMHLDTALSINPNHVPSLNSKAKHYLGEGQVEEAAMFVKRALKTEPRDMSALINYGVVLEKKDDLPEAESYYVRAIKVCEFCSKPRLYLGTLLLKQHKLIRAERQLLKSFELEPTRRCAHNLKELYTIRGDNDRIEIWHQNELNFE